MKSIKLIISCVLTLWATALSAQTHFTYEPNYGKDMRIFFQLANAGEVVDKTDNYEVAAFVGNTCRGVGEFVTAEGTNGQSVKYGYLVVHSNHDSGETVTFKYYDKKAQKEKTIRNASVDFVADTNVGLPSDPFILDIAAIDGDASDNGSVDANDIVVIVNYLLNKNSKINLDGADMNKDGKINIADIVQIVNRIMGN